MIIHSVTFTVLLRLNLYLLQIIVILVKYLFFGGKKMSIDTEIHDKIVNALKGANFPIKNEEELFNSFPQGEGGKCTVGAFQMSVTEFRRLLADDDLPFKNADEVAHVVIKRINRPGRW